jgi:hypothetical protein
MRKNYFFAFLNHWSKESDPELNPDPESDSQFDPDPEQDLLLRGTDPRIWIWIHTNMSRIPNTERKRTIFSLWGLSYLPSTILLSFPNSTAVPVRVLKQEEVYPLSSRTRTVRTLCLHSLSIKQSTKSTLIQIDNSNHNFLAELHIHCNSLISSHPP